MNIKIRDYKDSDYEDVKINLQEGNLYDSVWDDKSNLESFVQKDPQSILVAETDGKVVGNIILVSYGSHIQYFFRLAIRKEYRKKGIGSKLIKKMETIAKERGFKETGMYVHAEDTELQEYYKKKDYTTTGNHFIFMYKPFN